jgi:hypothetical protein
MWDSAAGVAALLEAIRLHRPGGMVDEPIPEVRFWLDWIFSKYLLNSNGTTKVKVHGFGVNDVGLLKDYPWFSCDSTTWVQTSRHGGLQMDLPCDGGGHDDVRVDLARRDRSNIKICPEGSTAG